ncbi:putative protein kinase RLK-Pelle-CrRLK1L-1 family [Helianthus debilis subsp. tardiflorus]
MASTTLNTKLSDLQIPLEDVVKATNNFHDDNIIGRGGLGLAYKGQLQRSGNFIKISALRLDRKQGEGEVEFWTEISVLSDLNHTNLVSIIGFCDEKDEKVIVTTYAAKGSLKEHLRNPNLTWTQRLQICLGVARALSNLYYEDGRSYGVIHRNINSSTILLDENWEAKLSGFKISIKQLVNRMDRVILSEPIGLKGYMDPEFQKIKGVTHKSDIYSFGVVLFEILCGRRAYIENGANRFLSKLVKYHSGKKTLEEIIYPDIRNQMSTGSLRIYVELAYSCINDDRANRPNMDKILEELEKALKLQLRRENILNNLEHLKIPLSDISLATDNFSDKSEINFRYYYIWYQGELKCLNKENSPLIEGKNIGEPSKRDDTVLIKRIRPKEDGQEEEVFYTEVEILSSVKHQNIVTLLGFCIEGSEMILVIDNALNYLHNEMEDKKVVLTRLIYGHIIGLDENWRAKIGFVGLSVFMPPMEDEVLYHNMPLYESMNKYYLDPEYQDTGKLKRETDVYSFGVFMFAILGWKSATDDLYTKENFKGVAPVARRRFDDGTIVNLIDSIIMEETVKKNSKLNSAASKDSLDTFIGIAYRCLAETQDKRPTMKAVIMELEKALMFQEKTKDIRRIPLEDINLATKNFHDDNCIYIEGCAKVYKGNLQDGDVTSTIAAKRLDIKSAIEEKGFWTELQVLWEFKHENVIGLLGYCVEKDERIIVYEYTCKGSLDKYINDVSLTWVERLHICIDVASALYHFHEEVEKQAKMIYWGVKSTNILLNHDWSAKLATFGHSLISPLTHETCDVTNHAFGTLGCMDPLSKRSGFMTMEFDIYSFGVVLLEILCGASTLLIDKHGGHYPSDFIKNKLEEGKYEEVVFEQIREQIDPKSVTTFQKIAYRCLHREREEPLSTKAVLMQLQKALAYQDMASTMTKVAPLQIPLEDVLKSTNNFHPDNVIGHNGFGPVYKGQLLQSGRLRRIAAQRFDCKQEEGDLQFWSQISVLSDLKQTNVVSIVGVCDEKDEKIIITTYEARGSLGQYLSNPNFTWRQRLSLCIGVARALSYLHYDKGRDYAIIHCNINSDTILLDENWEAKLSGFEISIKQLLYNKDRAYLCEHIGTVGLMDPAIKKMGDVTHKSDIYSLGVVLFEILCGRKAYNDNKANSFLALATQHYANKTLQEIILPDVWNQMSPGALTKFSKLANSCLNEDPAHHPNIGNVVNELEKTLELLLRRENILNNLEHLKIPLSDISLATDNFSDKSEINFRYYYIWYQGELKCLNKENSPLIEGKNIGEPSKRDDTVLIKRIRPKEDGQEEEVFYTEVEILSSVKHQNIVTLLGFCIEGSEMILVIDNVCNTYIGEHFGRDNDLRRTLTWEKRLKICIDVAQALNYLHNEMEDKKVVLTRLIYGHIIGLDENWRAKIGFVGLSVFMPPMEDEVLYHNMPLYESMNKYYLDPEYQDTGVAPVARRRFDDGTIVNLIDSIIMEETVKKNSKLNSAASKDSLDTFIGIAYRCLAETQDKRPTMKAVIMELEKALMFQEKTKDIRRIPLEDINLATKNFHDDNCIYIEGCAKVYKGNLQDGDVTSTIAAKRLDIKSAIEEKGFWTELQVLWEFKHENVIGLLGYCVEKDERIIVYEYTCKGSLDKYINDVSLTWVERLHICIDVASALYHFHEEVEKQAKMIYWGVKSTNILLNHDWSAKLATFGHSLIRTLTHETCDVTNHAFGTLGCMDPLSKRSGFMTMEFDIYSFGVVLLEILCGASTLLIDKHGGHYPSDFIKNKLEEGKYEEVVFEQIREQIDPKSVTTFQKIAYRCLHREREEPLSTKAVLMQLQKALAYQEMASTMTKVAPLQIPLEDVLKSTNNFHPDNVIGHNGFGPVYKGQLLQSGRLRRIAAQRFDCKQEEGDLQFWSQISVLSDLKQTNVVSIVGVCDEKDEKIIITTYEARGSLGQYLNNPNFTWRQRLSLCIGVARALSYLHYDKGRDYAIIHCNINSDTILLDENWEAKLSGFEISIKQLLYNKDRAYLCEHIGTMGCLDPAIKKMGGVTHKSDIYSLGVVLFEILCGRKAYNDNKANSFLALATQHYANETLQEIILPDVWNQMSLGALTKFSKLANSCLNEDPAHRPNIDNVVDELEKTLELLLLRENIANNLEHLKIPLSDISLATDNFSDESEIYYHFDYIWYRGELNCNNKESPPSTEGKNKGKPSKRHNTVLIKRIRHGYDDEREQEFYTDIEILSSVKHRGIATLLGFCIEGFETIVVLDDVSNGIMGEYFGEDNDLCRVLTWEKRLKICIDVAHSLNHLRSKIGDQKAVLTHYIQSLNIGLDENWEAKIGYITFRSYSMDPEYGALIRRETDIYSFGVLLFEILCWKMGSDLLYENMSDKGQALVGRPSFCTLTLESMIDPVIKKGTGEKNFVLNRGPNKDSLDICMKIAYQCVTENEEKRPTMEVVVNELEKALFFQKTNNPVISLEDIRQATNNLDSKNCIGGGGFGRVFKGKLQHNDGFKAIVAKQLDPKFGQGEQQFLTELQILIEYKHENVIGLVGYCDEKNEKIIVYEYAPKGSLDRYLSDVSLRWVDRLNICIDIASALCFFHGGAGKQAKVIHRDIKTANILLNDDWKAKLGDFGLSLISPIIKETDYVIDHACGTRGYLDPIYHKSKFLTIESDIYSFGVVLFEILCGKSTYEINKCEGHYLPDFIKRSFEEGKNDELVFEHIRDQIVPESLTTFQKIAYQCLHYEREKRPKTKEVLSQLKRALEFQLQMKEDV